MRLLSFHQLRETLGGRSRSSIYRDCDNDRLPPPIKIGARLYWREDEVEVAVEAHRVLAFGTARIKAGIKGAGVVELKAIDAHE